MHNHYSRRHPQGGRLEVAPRLLADKLEDELQCELTNSGIRGRSQPAKIPITDCGEVVHRSFVTKEVDLIEDVEELAT